MSEAVQISNNQEALEHLQQVRENLENLQGLAINEGLTDQGAAVTAVKSYIEGVLAYHSTMGTEVPEGAAAAENDLTDAIVLLAQVNLNIYHALGELQETIEKVESCVTDIASFTA